MKKKVVVFLSGMFIFLFASRVSIFAKDIIWDDIGRGNLNLKCTLVAVENPRIIYIGSSSAVLKSEDGGASWRSILSISGQKTDVNFLLFDPLERDCLYVATGSGLFISSDQGRSWRKIFKGKNYLESECRSLLVSPFGIYLGTGCGLFVSRDRGRSWYKESALPGDAGILAIVGSAKGANNIYLACTEGAYKSRDEGRSWEKIFVSQTAQDNPEVEDPAEEQDQEEVYSGLRYIAIEPNNANVVYLATTRGVYRSIDAGVSWEGLSSYGLLNKDVQFLFVSPESRIFALTKSGIFEHTQERWEELSLGLGMEQVIFLAADKRNNLYATTNLGLFKAHISSEESSQESILQNLYCKGQPSINAVQQAAINYAEVEPEKIKKWRSLAARKAVLPKVSAGLNRDTGDLWHWESGSTTKMGDDVLMRGRDAVNWDVSLSWDLSELVWSTDQTSIDARSRLSVQLRDEILDEVTKLYFERLREKIELDNLSIEDRKKRFEKELKVQELSAMLDGLTGGYFSQQINKIKTGS